MWERSVIAEEGFELCYLDDSWGYIYIYIAEGCFEHTGSGF